MIFDKEYRKNIAIKNFSEMAEDLFTTCDCQTKQLIEFQATIESYRKICNDYRDKLHRRNMQIKELKEKIEELKQFENDIFDN